MTCPRIFAECTQCDGKCIKADIARTDADHRKARAQFTFWDRALTVAFVLGYLASVGLIISIIPDALARQQAALEQQ